MMTKEFVKKLTTINPYLSAPTADTEAQVIIMGHNHLNKIEHLMLTLHDGSVGLCMVYMIKGDIFFLSQTAL